MSYYAKVGDTITVPIKLQIVKVYAADDQIFYLTLPIDNPKRMVALADPFFMVCTEPDADSRLPDMPMDMLNKAATYAQEFLEEDEGDNDDGPTSPPDTPAEE